MKHRRYFEARLEAVAQLLAERDDRYQQRFEQQNANLAIAMKASEDAKAKAEATIEKRLEGQNEFRAQLKDQAHSFVTKREVYLAIGLMITLFVALRQYLPPVTP